MRVLVVEDVATVAAIIESALRSAGMEAVCVPTSAAALASRAVFQPEIVLLDLSLPDGDGINLVAPFVSDGCGVIVVTASGAETERVAALDRGADDYIVKPYKAEELTARIRARLRPQASDVSPTLAIGDLTIDVQGHEVRRNGELLLLTPLEFDLLVALASQPSLVFTREMLLEQVWGYQYKADTRLVNVHVQRLRGKIEEDPDNPRVVMTVRGVGYRAGFVV